MQFLLSDQEAIELIRSGTRSNDGRLIIDIPESFLQTDRPYAVAMAFNTDARTVSVGSNSVRLSPTQFALLKLVHDRQRVGFEDAQDVVWSGFASDSTIRAVCSQISAKLSGIGASVALSARKGVIHLESYS